MKLDEIAGSTDVRRTAFDKAWKAGEAEGTVDGHGGAEYRRAWKEFTSATNKLAAGPFVRQFGGDSKED